MQKARMTKKARITTAVISCTAVLLAIFLMAVSIPKYRIEAPMDKDIKIEVGTKFVDKGAQTYLGNKKIGAKIYSKNKVDTEKLGKYELLYNSKFLWRKAQNKINVEVVDTQAPNIELVETDKLTAVGTEYQEEGFKAYDNYDGDITSLVERRIEGKNVIYKVTDSSGNTAQVTRNIKYKDLKAPKITLMGGSTVTINEGQKFDDPGFTAIDDVDGDLSQKTEVKSDVDSSKAGTYRVFYTVKDKTGNESEMIRTVIVKKDAFKPQKPIKPNGKVVYLTFDDGPSEHTPRLLNILKKYNVKATFFVVGSANMNYLDDIVNGGHSIGLHTMTHNYAKIYSDENVFMDEIYKLRRIVYNHTGVDTTMIRFPGGSSNTVSKRYKKGVMTNLVKRISSEGYQYYDWNVSSGDAGETTSSYKVYQNVINGVRNQKMSIVLQHDSKGYSVDAAENIIKWCLSNGYTLKRLTPSSPTVHHPIHN